jgi:hypothetical protein
MLGVVHVLLSMIFATSMDTQGQALRLTMRPQGCFDHWKLRKPS